MKEQKLKMVAQFRTSQGQTENNPSRLVRAKNYVLAGKYKPNFNLSEMINGIC